MPDTGVGSDPGRVSAVPPPVVAPVVTALIGHWQPASAQPGDPSRAAHHDHQQPAAPPSHGKAAGSLTGGSSLNARSIADYETQKRWWKDLKVDSRRRHCQAVCLRQLQCRSRRKRGVYRWSCRDSSLPCGPEGAAVWLSLLHLFTAAGIIAVGIVWSWVQYNGSGSVNTLGYRFSTLTGWGLVISALYFLAAGIGFWLAALAAGRCRRAAADAFTCGRSRKRRMAAAQAHGRRERPWWAPSTWMAADTQAGASTVQPLQGTGTARVQVDAPARPPSVALATGTGAAKDEAQPPSVPGGLGPPQAVSDSEAPAPSLSDSESQLRATQQVAVDVESKAAARSPMLSSAVNSDATLRSESAARHGAVHHTDRVADHDVPAGGDAGFPPTKPQIGTQSNALQSSAGGLSSALPFVRLPPPTTLFDPHDAEWSIDNYPPVPVPGPLRVGFPDRSQASALAAPAPAPDQLSAAKDPAPASSAPDSGGGIAASGSPNSKHSLVSKRVRMRRLLQRVDSGWRGAVILLWAFALPLEFVITLLFWAAGIALGAGSDFSGRPSDQVASSVLQHVVIVPLLVDLACNRVPVLPAHALYLSLLFLAYIITNVLYTTLVDAPPVYSEITWTNATSYYVTVIGFLLLYAAFALAWAVTRAKRAICGYGDSRKRLAPGEVGRRELDASTGATMEAGRHTVLVTVPPSPVRARLQATAGAAGDAETSATFVGPTGTAASREQGHGSRPRSFEGGRGEL